jgi:hypothetical protein
MGVYVMNKEELQELSFKVFHLYELQDNQGKCLYKDLDTVTKLAIEYGLDILTNDQEYCIVQRRTKCKRHLRIHKIKKWLKGTDSKEQDVIILVLKALLELSDDTI